MPVTFMDCKRLLVMSIKFYIKEVSWASHEAELRQIREQVFIVEQHVPAWVEWDAYDVDAVHLLAFDEKDQPIGCTRILDAGRVGRMAVYKEWRNCGVGKALLDKAISVLKHKNYNKVVLSAQTHAIKFYQKMGFVVTSEPYIDVNIWHVDMQLII